MRFSCENCQAKYQVADEKVAGKTIRMKCRKCGHSIEVKPVQAAQLPEIEFGGFVASNPPTIARTMAAPVSYPDLGATEQHPIAPSPETRGGEGFGAQSVMGSHFPGPEGTASRGPFDSSPGFVRAPESLRLALGGPEGSELPVHFWYVAIGGAPVGPIALAELISKARDGAIHDRSLAWREGLPEWQPIGNLPELVEAIGPSLAHAAPGRPASIAAIMAVPRAGGPAAASAKSRDSHDPSRTLAVQQMPEEVRALLAGSGAAVSLAGSPQSDVGSTAPSARSTGSQQEARAHGVHEAAPLSALVPAPRRASEATPLVAFALGALGLIVGFAAGRLTAPMPSSATPAPATTVQSTDKFAGEAEDKSDDVPAPPRGVEKKLDPAPVAARPTPAPVPAPRVVPPPVLAAAPPPIANPALNSEPPKTTVAAAAPPGPSMGSSFGGGASLTEGQILQVLASRKIQLRRVCWERLENHDSAVKVTATVSIDGSGRVQSVEATGSDTAVTNCIRNQIRDWTFPASGAATTAALPFSFLSQ